MRLAKDERVSCVCSASLLAALICFCAHPASAQRINASASSKVTDAAPSASIGGAIARGPGGEHAGATSFSTDQSTSRIASGKVQGYGQKLNPWAQSESAAPGGAASFSSSLDFPETDFVATMPRPVYAGPSPGASGLGLHLSGGAVSSSHAFSSSGTHVSSSIAPPPTHLKSVESILNPFTPSSGGGLGSLPSTSVGRLP